MPKEDPPVVVNTGRVVPDEDPAPDDPTKAPPVVPDVSDRNWMPPEDR